MHGPMSSDNHHPRTGSLLVRGMEDYTDEELERKTSQLAIDMLDLERILRGYRVALDTGRQIRMERDAAAGKRLPYPS